MSTLAQPPRGDLAQPASEWDSFQAAGASFRESRDCIFYRSARSDLGLFFVGVKRTKMEAMPYEVQFGLMPSVDAPSQDLSAGRFQNVSFYMSQEGSVKDVAKTGGPGSYPDTIGFYQDNFEQPLRRVANSVKDGDEGMRVLNGFFRAPRNVVLSVDLMPSKKA